MAEGAHEYVGTIGAELGELPHAVVHAAFAHTVLPLGIDVGAVGDVGKPELAVVLVHHVLAQAVDDALRVAGAQKFEVNVAHAALPQRMFRRSRQPGAHAARMTALAVAEHGHKQPRGGCVCLVVAPGAVEHLSQGGYTRGIVEFQQPQSEGRYQLHACAVAGGAVGAEQAVYALGRCLVEREGDPGAVKELFAEHAQLPALGVGLRVNATDVERRCHALAHGVHLRSHSGQAALRVHREGAQGVVVERRGGARHHAAVCPVHYGAQFGPQVVVAVAAAGVGGAVGKIAQHIAVMLARTFDSCAQVVGHLALRQRTQ